MKREPRKVYKKHLKQVKERYGFFPKDFKKTLKCHYKAFYKHYGGILF